MFCKNCGSEIIQGNKFCQNCGEPVADTVPVENTVPQAPSAPMSQMEQSAAQHGIYVAKPKDSNVATPRPQQQPREKKSANPKKLITSLVAVLMVAVLLFTGLISPAWMKGSGNAKVSFPKEDKATVCMNTVATMAIQAEINALLTEEKLYRAVEQGKPIAEVQELLDQNAKAWEIVDVLSSEAYVMSYSLYKSEKNSSKKSNKAMITPFELTAFAADDLNRSRFENDKQWAEYITEIYDHAKTNKVAYVAKLLKTDVNRAKEAIEKSQAIIKGEAISQAKKDTMILGALQIAKATGKVAGVAATVASGGTLSGIMSVGGFVAGAADAAIEVVDTGLIITLGEDNVVTKKFEEGMDKVAPIIGIASLANLSSWEKGADIVGNLRYIADGIVEIDTKGTLFGINLKDGAAALADGSQMLNMTEKQKKEIVEAFEKVGVKKEVMEEAVKTAVEEAKKAASSTEQPANEKPAAAESNETPFSELSDEKLDEVIEETTFENTDWEQIFKELDEEFREHMEKNGNLPDDDYLWDYDPFMPFEDYPQDGDEDGDWDDPSKWSKPDMPYEEPEEEYNEGEETQTDDEEPDDEDEEEEPTEEETTEEADDITRLVGTYSGSYTMRGYAGAEAGTVTDSDSVSVEVNIENGKVVPNFGVSIDSVRWDEDSLSGSGYINEDGDRNKVNWSFKETDNAIKLSIDIYDAGHSGDIYLIEAHYKSSKSK